MLLTISMKRVKIAAPKQSLATALTIAKSSGAPLSKNQQAFNQLTARIEKLQKEIKKKQTLFDDALNLYGKEVVPLQDQLANQSRQLLDLIFPVYKKQQLPKTFRPLLKQMLQDHMQTVMQNLPGEPDAELKEMFRQLEGERYETVLKREEQMMKDQMQDVFKRWGMDMDINPAEMSEEEMAAKMAEIQEQLNNQRESEQQRHEELRKTRPKTGKQAEKEKAEQAAEALKQKSISNLYRQLAKLLHPDLEQDEMRQAEKLGLMQQVIRAYEAKDLHTLLLLEMKWIHNEQGHLQTLADEKLVLYLQLLREQAKELEQEKWQMINHPRYGVLVDSYGYRISTNPIKAVQNDLVGLSSEYKKQRFDIEQLQTPQAVQHLKTMVNNWKLENEADNEDDLLSMLMAISGR